MKKTVIFFLITILTLPFAAAISPKFDAHSRLHFATHTTAARSSAPVKAFISVRDGFDVAELDMVEVLRRLGNVLLVSADTDALEAAAQLDGVIRISIEKELRTANHISAEVIGSRAVASGSVDRQPFTGKNVLAGLFDTGFDVQNPSFRRADGTNRIERLFHYPEYNSDAIIYEAETLKDLETENVNDCHGTHVLGTMAGKYRGDIVRATGTDTRETVDGSYFDGMATDAAIAVAAGNLSDANIIDGIGRIIEHADQTGRPCVINLSISEITGPHDGSDPFATALSELAKEAVIVMSSGNYATHKRTISKTFTSDDSSVGTFLWPIWWSLDHEGILAVWSGGEEPLSLNLQIGRNDKTILQDIPISAETDEYIIVTEDYTGGEGRPEGVKNANFNIGYTDSYIAVFTDRSPSGRHCYYIVYELHRRSGGNIMPGVLVSGNAGQRVDMYLESDLGELLGFYMDGYRDGGDDMTISSMAAADGTISVGAWTGLAEWPTLSGGLKNMDETGYTEGTIARFSSYGTLIDGRTLPLTAAPGAAVISVYSTPYLKAHSNDPYGICAQSTDTSEPVYWTAMYGTSMSSPVVAGSIAQWLEADPTLTAQDIIDIIERTSTVDDAVLDCPERWGAGKFNALAGLSEVLTRKASAASPVIGDRKLIVLRNGSDIEIFIDGESTFEAAVYTVGGTCTARGRATDGKVTIDATNLQRGIYIIRAGEFSQKIII